MFIGGNTSVQRKSFRKSIVIAAADKIRRGEALLAAGVDELFSVS
jgi:hypothetical protein